MNRDSFKVFDKVCAEAELKKRTADYLNARIKGETKQSPARRKRAAFRGFAAAFACLAVILVCAGLSRRLYFTPAAYIDIDVNPSIELTVNRMGRVIGSSAHNDDGAELLEETDLSSSGYGEAVERLLGAMAADGYFEKDSQIFITVQADESGWEESILSGLREAVDAVRRECRHNIAADVYAVTDEVKHCADENQISPAKYLAIQELLEVDPEADFEECKGHSVHELQQWTKERCGWHQEHGGDDEPDGCDDIGCY